MATKAWRSSVLLAKHVAAWEVNLTSFLHLLAIDNKVVLISSNKCSLSFDAGVSSRCSDSFFSRPVVITQASSKSESTRVLSEVSVDCCIAPSPDRFIAPKGHTTPLSASAVTLHETVELSGWVKLGCSTTELFTSSYLHFQKDDKSYAKWGRAWEWG